jgi:hypothetical protein
VSKLITKVLAGLAALAVVAGLAYLARPDAEAPKRDDLTFDRPSASPTTATTFIPLPLFNELKEGNYKDGPLTQRISDGAVKSVQVWTSKRGHKVELAATDSTPMKLKSVTFPQHDGQRWTCTPEKSETISYVITYGEVLRKSVADGTTEMHSDGPSHYVNGGTIDCTVL